MRALAAGAAAVTRAKKTFLCRGEKDGECGEKHRSVKAATECCDRRRREVPKTDRVPVPASGSEISVEDAYAIRSWKALRELARP